MAAELMFGNQSRFDYRMLTVWLRIAMDLFIAPTLSFELLYTIVIVRRGRHVPREQAGYIGFLFVGA